ncbi:hypothetical protein AK812_SmicGene13544 [Symbiodinium microadriaticum]|uniref:Uncharacterized protein n=1 Tax=Symbiodinium microadriaticum TaxID=2951 RepID=A0A1Q9E7V8_SYMMI|nr:hypothetical protein AK812_SmicGene13544 [Symbiodinium microadriaticum]
MEKSMQLLPMLRMMLNRSTSLMVFLTTMSDAMKGTKKGKVLTSLLTDQESCPLTNGSVSSPLQANLVCSSAIILRLAENGKVITLSLISKISSAMPREPVFKRIYCSPKEQWTFPMRAIYDKRSRTVCVDDPAMLKGSSKDGNELFQEPGIDDDRALFEFDAGRSMTEEEIAIARVLGGGDGLPYEQSEIIGTMTRPPELSSVKVPTGVRFTSQGETAHVGRVFDGICVEKDSELPESDPNRKFKGRVVFEGCHVKDEGNNWARFSEITYILPGNDGSWPGR